MLWIRTQNKKRLINVVEVHIFSGDRGCVVYGTYSSIDGCDELGKYKTVKRGVEILDEIQEKIECDLDYKLSTIYEMPEE